MTISAPNRAPLKCYLIDDDLDDQEIFYMALQQFDESILCDFANDGSKAIEQLSTRVDNAPDCIFIDVNMPRMNGIECLEQLKKMDHLKSIPTCMFSTSADHVLVGRAKALGAVDFIVKPPDIFVLSEMLGQFFNLNVITK